MSGLMNPECVISPCGLYRYTLPRLIELAPSSWLLWVMLNPSTADATHDDPTIKRVVTYTRQFGYGAAMVANLYAYRATDPGSMWRAQSAGTDIIGPDNDSHLHHLAAQADSIVVAWGAQAERTPERALVVLRLLMKRKEVYALSFTKMGQPAHPLYQKRDLELVRIPE